MKKILSILLVALLLVGMLPANAIHSHAAEAVTETLTVKGNTGVMSGTASISWSQGGVTFTNYKASSTTAIRTSDGDHYRVYGKSEVEVTAPGNITKIVITSTGSSYNTPWVESAKAIGTASNSGNVITVVPTTPATSLKFSATAQVRLNKIEVTYEVAGGDTGCTHANTVNVDAVAATCTTPGFTAGVQCTDCEAYIEGHEAVASTGHTMGDWNVVTAATCTEAGEQTRGCENCDLVETQAIAALGHDYDENGTCGVCGYEAVLTKYELVTDAASLKDGDQLVIVGVDQNGKYYAMLAYDSGNNVKTEEIDAPVDGKITLADTSAAAILVLGGDASGWTLFDGAKYLYAPGKAANNYLKAVATLPTDNTGAWTISIAEGGIATITNVGNNVDGARNTVKFNYGNSPVLFSCYKADYATNVTLVSLYRLAVAEPEQPEVCTHENTTTTNTATCTEAGVKTVVCSDCGETISTEEVAALGHSYVEGTCSVCGAKDPNFEGPIDPSGPNVTEPSEPEVTEPSEPSEPEVTEPSEPVTPPAASTEETIDFSTLDQRVSCDSNSQVWTNGDLTVTNNKAASTTNIDPQYFNPARFYKSSQLVVEYEGMTKIEVACNTTSYATALKNSISDTTVAVSVNDKVVTIVLAEATDSYTVTLSGGQVRVDSITVYAEVSTCDHVWGEWVETTAPTCTENGVSTSTCSLCGETKTQSIDALGHNYTYADGAMTCTCGDAKTISSIADAKAYTSTSQVYYIKGIVTYISGKTVYIEDANDGVCVYFAAAPTDIALGDEIVVWDTMTDYKGLIETTNTTAQEYTKISSGNKLPCKTVTLADLKADTTKEYLGERVKIENVVIGVLGTDYTALTDANGNTINIYKLDGQSAEIAQNDTVTVIAIVSTYNGYQLIVNPGTAADDVVKIASGEVEVIETVFIADALAGTAGEFYQVEGIVTYIAGRNVYIQDETGAMVVYLKADAETTQVGDKVKVYGALKSYYGLMELDAVDETNAKFYEILSSGNSVDALALTIADLLNDAENAYHAEKIQLNDVYISYFNYNSDRNDVTYTLIDAQGDTIKINRVAVSGEADCYAPGSLVTLEAFVSVYKSASTQGNGYQLVTTNDKITVLSVCAHETTELINAVAATCTTGGYTGDTQCTVCKYYVSRGEDVAALEHNWVEEVIAPTCTERGYTKTYCDRCGEADDDSEFVNALGHNWVEEVIAPTCTERGYTKTYCDRCGEADDDSEFVNALGHSYVDGTCSACGAEDPDYVVPLPEVTFKIKSAAPMLEADMTLYYKVDEKIFAPGAYTNPYMVFQITDADGNVREDVVKDYITMDGNMMFAFKGISPYMMKANIVATLYGTFNGVEYSTTVEKYSMATYCYNQFKKTDDQTLLCLLSNMLNFGTAHQKYAGYDLENLINAEMTETQKGYASTYELTLENIGNSMYEELPGATAEFKGGTLVLENAVLVRVNVVCDDLEGAYVRFTAGEIEYDVPSENWEKNPSYDNRYYVYLNVLQAYHMRTEIQARVYRGETLISHTLRYSIESYAASKIGVPNLTELLTAMMYYGDSVAAYFNQQ